MTTEESTSPTQRMETEQLKTIIRERRTTHRFLPDSAPDPVLIKELLDTAMWAPTHWMKEPWHFYLIGEATKVKIIVRNTDLLRELGKDESIVLQKAQRWSEMPGWIVVTSDLGDRDVVTTENYAATACAIQNFLLLLQAEGIHSKWSTGPVTFDPEFYQICGIDPDKAQVVGLLWYGHEAVRKPSTRQPLADKLTELD